MPHPRLGQVRRRYGYRCGYCGVSETDTGGELTVDHYQPVTTGGTDDDQNLVYACIRCNQYKGRFFPSTEDLSYGRRVLHPARDDIYEHLREDRDTGLLQPMTETGRFHVAILQLNRSALVEYRLRRHLSVLLAERLDALLLENDQLRANIAAQEEYIVQLQRLFGVPKRE
jgi:hypothetical protein